MLELAQFVKTLKIRFAGYENLENKISEYVANLVVTDNGLIQGIYIGQKQDLVNDFFLFINK